MGHPALRPPGRPRPFRLAQNKKIIRRGGIYPARRRSRRRGVRRDEGIPPYGRPGGRSPSALARNIKFIRRGGIYPARGVCAAAGFPGAQCAPLQGARWGWLCGWPQVFPSARRGGFHIRPQTSRHRKPGRYRIGPYNISTKIFIPPKKPETPARQPFSLNGRRAGFSCQVFLAILGCI